MYFIQVINLFLISTYRQIFSFIIIYNFRSNGLLQGICACLNSMIWRSIANIRISIHELKWNVLSPMSRRFYHVERWNPNRQRDGCPAQDNAPASAQDDRKRRTPSRKGRPGVESAESGDCGVFWETDMLLTYKHPKMNAKSCIKCDVLCAHMSEKTPYGVYSAIRSFPY